jgi:hypothetical protein
MSRNSPLLREMKYQEDEKDIKNSDVESQESAFEEESKPKNCCAYLYGCLGHYNVRILAGLTSAGALAALTMAIIVCSKHAEGYVPEDDITTSLDALVAMNGQTNIRLNSLIAGVIAGSLGMAGLMFSTFHLYWKNQYKLLEEKYVELKNLIEETSKKSHPEEYKGGIAYDLKTHGIIQNINNNQQWDIQQSTINSQFRG